MFVGCLTQQSDDGAEELVEWYIAYPFKEALEQLRQTHMFKGKSLNIASKQSLKIMANPKPTFEPDKKVTMQKLPNGSYPSQMFEVQWH